jgi:hypothetical protein
MVKPEFKYVDEYASGVPENEEDLGDEIQSLCTRAYMALPAAVPVVRPRCPPVWLTRTRPGRALTFSIDGRQYVVPIRALVRVIHGEQAEAEISTPVEDAAQLDDATGRQATLGVWA